MPSNDFSMATSSTSSVLNYSEVECLQRKRLLTFFNHFLSRNVTFLSDFSRDCEQRLARMANKIQKMEHSLTLLENKLNSIPQAAGEEQQQVTDEK